MRRAKMERSFIEFAIFFLLVTTTTTTTFAVNDNTKNADSGATTHAVKKIRATPRMGGAAPPKMGKTTPKSGAAPITDEATPKTGGGAPKTTGGATPNMGFVNHRTGVAPPPKTGGIAPPAPLLPQEQEFLKAHNEVRHRNGLPPLTWDRKCAAYARWYAKSRSKDCALKHSTGPFGENIFWGEGKTWTPKLAVEDWLEEHKYYNRQFHTCQSGKMCAHYTQIVWRDTQKVGCGHILCDTGDTYIVCSYDPPGNFKGKLPFEKHNPILYNQKDRLLKLSWLPNNY